MLASKIKIDDILKQENYKDIVKDLCVAWKKYPTNGDWIEDKSVMLINFLIRSLVLLQDLKMVIEPKELKNIQSFEDLKKTEKVDIDVSLLIKYLNYKATLELLHLLQNLFSEKIIISYIKSKSQKFSNLKSIQNVFLDKKTIDFLLDIHEDEFVKYEKKWKNTFCEYLKGEGCE